MIIHQHYIIMTSLTHSTDISFELHECISHEKVEFGLFATLEHHHQSRGGAHREMGLQGVCHIWVDWGRGGGEGRGG